jgi:hypothetical protein
MGNAFHLKFNFQEPGDNGPERKSYAELGYDVPPLRDWGELKDAGPPEKVAFLEWRAESRNVAKEEVGLTDPRPEPGEWTHNPLPPGGVWGGSNSRHFMPEHADAPGRDKSEWRRYEKHLAVERASDSSPPLLENPYAAVANATIRPPSSSTGRQTQSPYQPHKFHETRTRASDTRRARGR